MTEIYDIAIIGGGINGAGIARDAAGRGLRVLLVEKGDLAQGTSSASSKLIHGGLRYLEYYEFRLVREALQEREVLMAIAPHIIWPLEFILPQSKDTRPAWMVRAGLFLYDHLASRRSLAGSGGVALSPANVYGLPLKQRYAKGFRYSDCWVDDARLVLLNARDAADHGAHIRTRTACTGAERVDGQWRLQLQEQGTAQEQPMVAQARVLVNAAGPWVGEVLALSDMQAKGRAMLVKGSHIVVPRVHDGEHAYILQMPDKRIVFVLPFEQEFSLIGTTDMAYTGDPGQVAITQEEIDYLLEGANTYLAKTLSRADIQWSYSGVRALYEEDGKSLSAISRDYVLELEAELGAPMLTVFGGKITTYRRLAEQALEKLRPYLPRSAHEGWTDGRALPGGEKYHAPHWLDRKLADRWSRQYGSLVAKLIGDARDMAGLGEQVAPQVYEAELRYACDHEWVRCADDFLWRRTKLGLVLGEAERQAVEAWFAKS
jgi:glycerol-3-phosphate dehydrogenase